MEIALTHPPSPNGRKGEWGMGEETKNEWGKESSPTLPLSLSLFSSPALPLFHSPLPGEGLGGGRGSKKYHILPCAIFVLWLLLNGPEQTRRLTKGGKIRKRKTLEN